MRIMARQKHALNIAHSEKVSEFTIKAFLFKKNKSDQTLETQTPLTKLLFFFSLGRQVVRVNFGYQQ